jgi:RNA polymerase sigma factor (sigma-70 family)
MGVTWADVYRKEHDGLVRLAYLMTGSQPVAEDLVHDTFLRVMARIDAGDQPGAYLRRSVINACYSWHRRSWRERPAPPDEAGPYEVAPYGAGGRRAARQEAVDHPEDEIEMWDALSKLSPRRRAVLVLRYYLDLPEAEVAELVECRVGTVKSTAHRALGELRRALAR